MEYLYGYIGVYVMILICISLCIFKGESSEDFLMSGRDRNWFHIMFSKFAASVGVSWFIAYTGYAYKFGAGMYVLLLGFLLGYVLFAFWVVPRVYAIAKENRFYTQGDLVYYKTKSAIGKIITNYYSCVIQFTWLLVSFIGGAKVMSSIGAFSYEAALLFTIFTVLSYILIAGYKAVIITDIFQGFIIIVLFFLVTQDITSGEGLSSLLKLENQSLDIVSVIGLFLYGALSILALSDRYQLLYAAKTEKDIQRGIFLTFIPISLVGVFAIVLGLVMFSGNPELDPDLVFIQSIIDMENTSIVPLAFIMLFAGLMSSADTYIYSISSHIVINRNNKNYKENITDIRFMTIVVVFIAGVIAYFFRDIIGITIIGAALGLIMSIPMIYIINGGESNSRFLSSLLGGFVGLIIGIILLGLEPSLALVVLAGGLLGLLKN